MKRATMVQICIHSFSIQKQNGTIVFINVVCIFSFQITIVQVSTSLLTLFSCERVFINQCEAVPMRDNTPISLCLDAALIFLHTVGQVSLHSTDITFHPALAESAGTTALRPVSCWVSLFQRDRNSQFAFCPPPMIITANSERSLCPSTWGEDGK